MGALEEGEKASEYLSRFRLALGECNMDDVARWALMKHLPVHIQSVLINDQEHKSVDELAAAADQLLSSPGTQALTCAAVDNQEDFMLNKVKKETNDGLCWRHRRFKQRAFKCEDPKNCHFPKNGQRASVNGQAR